LVYDFVFANAASGSAPLIGNLMLVVETFDESLCAVNKVAFDVVQLTQTQPFETFNVREAYIESPLALPHIIQAEDSSFPIIGVDWYACPTGGNKWGLALVRKTASGAIQGLVSFRAYEDANYRIVAVGMVQGYIQGASRSNNFVTSGSSFRFDAGHARWVLTDGFNDECFIAPNEADKYNFNEMPANGPFFVVDTRRITLLNRQAQIVTPVEAEGIARL